MENIEKMEKMVWKPLKFRGDIINNYEVSSEGELRNVKRNKVLKGKITLDGYRMFTIRINRKSYHVQGHRAVAETLLENPDNLPVVNHKDRNRRNNSVENLEWVTISGNVLHSYTSGNRKSNSRAVNQIDKTSGKVLRSFESVTKASKEVGGDGASISKCAKGKRKTSAGFVWRFVVEKENPPEDVPFRIFNGYNVYANGKISKNTIMKTTIISGYESVNLSMNGKVKHYFVHRLVAECFIPQIDPKKDKVNHKDGNKFNNDVSNLEWVTHQENMRHAVDILGMNKKAISQYDLNGTFIRTYESMKEAGKAVGSKNNTNISPACSGKQKTAYGFRWKFK